MEANLQDFLALLRARNPSLANQLAIECFRMCKEEAYSPGVQDMAEQIMDALDNYFLHAQT